VLAGGEAAPITSALITVSIRTATSDFLT